MSHVPIFPIPTYVRITKNRIKLKRCDEKPLCIARQSQKPFSKGLILLEDLSTATYLLRKIRIQMLLAEPSGRQSSVVIQANTIDSKSKYDLDEMKLYDLARDAGFKDIAVWLGETLEASQVKNLLSSFH